MKALANDQIKVLMEMQHATKIELHPGIYDGDTPQKLRPKIRELCRIIISNPYALHQYLPWHYKWKKFFSNLKIIVIDEVHTYRGVFGSNVAMLIRRLLRICEHYGAYPVFFLASATIANPEELAQKLTGSDCEVVADDGSGSGRKLFMFWNPPIIEDTVRRSAHQETKDLYVHFIKSGLQTLCFATSRRMAELINRWATERLENDDPELAQRITAYRAGYLPEERREIERALRETTHRCNFDKCVRARYRYRLIRCCNYIRLPRNCNLNMATSR